MPPEAHGAGDWQLECGAIRERGARLLASEQWADCSFLPGAAAVPARAHRLILAMASPVFQAMFYGPVAEGDAPIPVPDIQPGVFNKLLQYMYTDDVDLENYNIAFEVYYAAEKYMLPHLQTLCTAYLADNLVPENTCGIYEFANFIEDKKLEDDSLKVIKDKTKLALAPDSSFEDLALGTVLHIFSLDTINIDSELDLLAAAERYVLAWQERDNEMADVNTSCAYVDSENDSASNRIDKDTNNVDNIIKCNGNSTGDIENHGEKISNDGQGEDEATAENQETTPSDTKPLQPARPEVVNRARPEATFRFTVNNVSKMEDIVYSPPFYVRNLPWKIWVASKGHRGQKYLGFHVQCNGESKSFAWSCKALIEYRLISHKPDTRPLCRKLEKWRLFSSKFYPSWGYSYFMAWNDVLDPEKGYVKDDAITLEVRVVAEPPQGLSWHSKGCIGDVDVENDLVRALLRPIRFLTLTVEQMSEYEPKLSLLTDQDILAIMMNIASKKTKKPLPTSFSTSTVRR